MKNVFLLSLFLVGVFGIRCTSSHVVSDSEDKSAQVETSVRTNQANVETPKAQNVPVKAPKTAMTKPVAKKPVVAAKTKRPSEKKIIKKTRQAVPTDRTKDAAEKVSQAAKEAATKKAIKKSTPAKVITHPVSKTDKPKVAKIALDEPKYSFGTIKEGTIIKKDFKFTNVGEADLLIEIATGSCGCTVPEWPAKPIKPGESGVIHVTFDSTDKEYDTRVEVNIVANTEPIVTEIIMTGKVIPKRDFKKKE